MRQRLLKILKRLLVVLVLLGALGLGAFTWFCYWPLEGSADDLLTLVPEDVEFVLRGDYDDLVSTGWVQANVLDHPLHPELADAVAETLHQVEARMAEIEGQINANIPVGALKFSVLDDVLRGETCISGRFCRGLNVDRGVPKWQEILVMTRVSWKTRCVAALKHGFVRDRLGPNLQVAPEADDVYHLTFPQVAPEPEELRAACEGFVIPPRNEWYLRRVKDVVAISNSKRLIQGVADLAEQRGSTRSFATRPGYDVRLQPGRITAAVNVEPLHRYLGSVFDYYPQLSVLRRFLPPDALERLSGSLSLAGNDLLAGGGKITYLPQNAPDVTRNVYSLPERAVREGISEMVPAKNTFALLSLRVDPHYLLNAIAEDFLLPEERRLWEQNLADVEDGGYPNLDAFFLDLSTRVGTEAMIALGRLGSVFDGLRYDSFWSDAPHATPVMAVMVRLKEGASEAEVEQYLSSKVPLLGFSRDLERISYSCRTYLRAALKRQSLDLKLVSPCFMLANEYLVITSNETYMREIIDTICDRSVPALERDDTFRVAMGPLPAQGHVGLFVDLEKLSRIPQDPAHPGADEQGLLWDRRNEWVLGNRDPRTEAIHTRRKLQADARRRAGGRELSPQQLDEIEKQVDAHLQAWYDNYPRFQEEYRQELGGLRRLRALGLVLGATDSQVEAGFAVILRDAEEWLPWRR